MSEFARIEQLENDLAAAEAKIARVEAWCDEKDRLSKGESPTTASVRAALRGDILAAGVLMIPETLPMSEPHVPHVPCVHCHHEEGRDETPY
jgi:cytochrome c